MRDFFNVSINLDLAFVIFILAWTAGVMLFLFSARMWRYFLVKISAHKTIQETTLATRPRRPSLKEEGLLVTESGTLLSLARLHERLGTKFGYNTTRQIIINSHLAGYIQESSDQPVEDILAQAGLRWKIDPTLASNKLGIRISGPGPKRTIWLKARRLAPIDMRRLQLGELTETEIWRVPSRQARETYLH